MMARKRADSGFTLIEIIITVAVIGLLIGPIIGTSYAFYSDTVASNRQATLDLGSQDALRTMSEDLRMSAGLDNTNAISDPNQPGGWTAGGTSKVLILASPAQDSTRNFIIDSATGKPYRNEIIYYRNGQNFYRRTLPNPSASGNAMTRSCPIAYETASCPADTTLLTKFDTATYTFYDYAHVETTTASAARSVKISVSVKDNVYGRTVDAQNTTRVTFRNS